MRLPQVLDGLSGLTFSVTVMPPLGRRVKWMPEYRQNPGWSEQCTDDLAEQARGTMDRVIPSSLNHLALDFSATFQSGSLPDWRTDYAITSGRCIASQPPSSPQWHRASGSRSSP